MSYEEEITKYMQGLVETGDHRGIVGIAARADEEIERLKMHVVMLYPLPTKLGRNGI